MAEGWMAEIVREADCFDDIRIYEEMIGEWRIRLAQKPSADGFADLGNLERMSQSSTVEIVFARPEDLGFVLKAPKGGGVQNTIAIDLERTTIIFLGSGFLQAFGIEGVVEVVPHGGLWGGSLNCFNL